MARKSKSIALLLLVILLLVLISSRISPREAMRTKSPAVTDDPIPSATVPPRETEPPATPSPTPPPASIRTILTGVSLSDWNLKLVNNTNILSSAFAPEVTDIRDQQFFDRRAADKLEEMLSAAEAAGFTVCVRTAYRPFSTQAYLFNGRASQIQWGTTMTLLEAETEARKVVAYPGTSEHQLGLCADIMDSKDTSMKAEEVENLPLLVWLRQHCAEYGFIARYPKNKQEITGWYEPWHFRYVGEEAAEYIMEHGICLEEFYASF